MHIVCINETYDMTEVTTAQKASERAKKNSKDTPNGPVSFLEKVGFVSGPLLLSGMVFRNFIGEECFLVGPPPAGNSNSVGFWPIVAHFQVPEAENGPKYH